MFIMLIPVYQLTCTYSITFFIKVYRNIYFSFYLYLSFIHAALSIFLSFLLYSFFLVSSPIYQSGNFIFYSRWPSSPMLGNWVYLHLSNSFLFFLCCVIYRYLRSYLRQPSIIIYTLGNLYSTSAYQSVSSYKQ